MSDPLAAEIAARAAELDSGGGPRSAEAGTQPPPASEAEQDAILARLDQQHGVQEDDPGDESSPTSYDDKPLTWTAEDRASGKDVVRTRDAKGRFQKQPEGDEPEPAEVELETPQEQPAERGVDQDELRLALEALRMDGYTNADLTAMSDEQIHRIGLKRHQSQAVVNEKLAERSRVIDHGQRAESPASPADPAQAPAAQVNGDESWAALESSMTDAVGDETLGKQVVSALRQAVETGQRAAQPPDSGDGAMLSAILEERVRARLGDRFPQLSKDDALWEKVSTEADGIFQARRARGLVPNGTPGTVLRAMDSAFEDAARIHAVDRGTKREQSDRQAAYRQRDNSQPARPTPTRTTRQTFRTREELDDAWLAARDDGTEHGDTERLAALRPLYQRVPAGQ